KRYQVFISSTYEDLKVEREIVSVAILRSGNIPSGMELSSGVNERTIDIIYQWIDDSDIFLLLIGGRYGSLNATTGLSYTELEYDHAKRRGIPVIAIVFSDAYLEKKIRAGLINATNALERVYAEKYQKFKSKVADDSYAITINGAEELEPKVLTGLDAVR